VNYFTLDDTTTYGEDYEFIEGTLTWADGESGSKSFSIPISNDTEIEDDETVIVELKDSEGNVFDTITLTIVDDDDEQEESTAETLQNIAKNPTQREMGRVIGTVCDSGQASARLQQRCEELVEEADDSPNEVANALQQIAPEEYMSQGYLASLATITLFKNVDARLKVLRTGVTGVSLSGFKLNMNINGQRLPSQLFASLLTYATDTTTQNVGAGFSRLGAFINGEINFGDKDTTERESGFEFSTLGLTAGVDYRFTDNLVAGIALGYTNSETDLKAGGGNIDNDGYSLSLYGTFYQSDAFYIDGLYSYGRNSYDNERNIVYSVANTSINQTALSSNDSDQQALGIGAGYHFNREAFTFTPNVRLDYVKTDIDGLTENAADPSALGSGWMVALDSQTVKSLTVTLGVQADYAMSQSWGVLIPHVDLELVHEFEDDIRQLNGRFLGDVSGESFSLNSDSPDRDYFNLGLGLLAQFTQGKAAFIRYEGTLGLRDLERHAIMGGVRFEF
jgi:outer membrane autotransporter protein